MFRITKAAGAVALAAVVLSGCVTAPPTQKITFEQARTEAAALVNHYDESHSLAWNLAYIAQKPQEDLVKDTYLPERDYAAATADPTAEPAVLVGREPYSKSTFFSDKETIDIFGFIERTEAYSQGEAVGYLYRQLLIAFNKTSSSMGLTGTQIEYPEPGVANWRGRSMETELSASFRMLSDGPELPSGCVSAAAVVQKPAWIDAKREHGWLITKGPLMWFRITKLKFNAQSAEQSRDLKIEFISRLEKHLPDGMYLYVPGLKDGKGLWHPDAVATNQRRHWFVMPESALAGTPAGSSTPTKFE